jgi:thiol-disulfide isomerase/thioredoxin
MTTSRLRLAGVLAAFSLSVLACGGSDDTVAGTEPPAGDEATGDPSAQQLSFTADQLDGAEFDATSLAGRPAVLWFWAPWCTTCRSEAPDVIESAAEFDGNVEIIGVAGRGERDAMEQFVAETNTGALTHVVDDDGSIWTDFQVAAQPAFAFIDADGEIVETFVGALGKEALTERMQQLAAN